MQLTSTKGNMVTPSIQITPILIGRMAAMLLTLPCTAGGGCALSVSSHRC